MPVDSVSTSRFSRSAFNDCLDRFDEAWQCGETPSIADYLPPSGVSCERGCNRAELLVELLMIDIECRWKQEFVSGNGGDPLGARPRLEDYVRCFPDLGTVDDLPLKLIKYEYEVRCRAGDSPAQQDYFSRFSKHGAALSAALSNVAGGSADFGAVQCPRCQTPIDRTDQPSATELSCPSCGGSVSAPFGERPSWRPRAGSTIGHFKLQKKLGEGAFGIVYRATDTILNRSVALKIPKHAILDEAERKRITHDGQAAGKLQHPNIVAIHDVVFEDGLAYVVSDYVEGQTLEKRNKARTRLPKSRKEFEDIATLIGAVALALDHAHKNNVFHRDVKSSNILVDSEGKPHLIDFGLAKHTEAGTITTEETKFLGTVAYMPPEQARGEAHLADARSDVYSLGVVLFELLTGSCPFRGTVQMVIQQVVDVKVDAPPPRSLNLQVPRDLQTICAKCLEKAPDRRYRSAQDLVDDLNRYLADEPILARPTTRLERGWKWCRRRPAAAALVAMSSLSLISVTVGALLYAEKLEKSNLEKQALNEHVTRVLASAPERLAKRQFREIARDLRDVNEKIKDNPDFTEPTKTAVRDYLTNAENGEVDSESKDRVDDQYDQLLAHTGTAQRKFAQLVIPLAVSRGTVEIPVDEITVAAINDQQQSLKSEPISVSLEEDIGADRTFALGMVSEAIAAAELALLSANVSVKSSAGETTIPLAEAKWLSPVQQRVVVEVSLEARAICHQATKLRAQLAPGPTSTASNGDFSSKADDPLLRQYEAIGSLLRLLDDRRSREATYSDIEKVIEQLEESPGATRSPWMPFFLAVAYGAYDKPEAALAHLTDFKTGFATTQSLPDELKAWVDLVRAKLLTQQFIRQREIGARDETNAEVSKAYESAEAAFSKSPAERSLRRLWLLNRATLRVARGDIARGDFEQAEADIIDAIRAAENGNNWTSAHLYLAFVLHRQRNYSDAIEKYKFVIDNMKEPYAAYRGQAEAHIALGDFVKAVGLYERIVYRGKPSPADRVRLATLYAKTEKRELAKKLVADVLARSDDYLEAHRLRAALANSKDAGERSKAIASLGKIINEGSASHLDYFMRALLTMNSDSAESDSGTTAVLEDLIKAAPPKATSVEHLQVLIFRATFYANRGARKSARADFKTVAQALESEWYRNLDSERKLSPEMLRQFYLGRGSVTVPVPLKALTQPISAREMADRELSRTFAEEYVVRAIGILPPDVETLLGAANIHARLAESLARTDATLSQFDAYASRGAEHLAQAVSLLRRQEDLGRNSWEAVNGQVYSVLRNKDAYLLVAPAWLSDLKKRYPDEFDRQKFSPKNAHRPRPDRLSVTPASPREEPQR